MEEELCFAVHRLEQFHICQLGHWLMGGNLDWSCAPTVRRSGVNRVLHFIVFDLAKIIFIRRRAAGPVKIVERSSGEVFKANFGQHRGVQQSIDVEIFSF